MQLCKIGFIIGLALSLIHCTKNKEKEVLKIGAYSYQLFPPKKDSNVVAKINDREIQVSQMMINGPSIKELQKRMGDYHLAFLYRMAREESAETKKLVYYLPTPQIGLEDLLKRFQFEIDPSVEYSFEESDSKAIASINGKEILFSDLQVNNLKYQELKSQIFKESLRALSKITTKLLLFDAAKAKNLNTQDYVAQQLPKDKVTLGEEEFQTYLEENNLAHDTKNNPELLERVRSIALQKKKNAYLEEFTAQNLLKKPIEIYIQEPQYRLNVKTDTAASLGNEKSKVKVFLFTQYNCDACSKIQKDLMSESYITDKTHLMNFYNFSERDREQILVAEASFCALKQGKFWEFSNQFHNENLALTEPNINNTVEKVGLNKEDFKACFLARETQKVQEYQVKYAKYLGLRSSPTLVIDGEVFSGPTDLQTIKDTVRRKLSKYGELGLWDRILAFFS